jgi:hypothetical protein
MSFCCAEGDKVCLATKTHRLRDDWKMVVDESVVMCNEATMRQLYTCGNNCKSNLTILRRILHLDLAKGNPK